MKYLTHILWMLNMLVTFGEGESQTSDQYKEAEDSDFFEDDFDLDDPNPGEDSDDDEDTEEEGDEDEEEDEDDEEDEEDSDDDDIEDDDDDDEEDAESESEDTEDDGEGGDEEGVDSAVAETLRANWEARLAAEAAGTKDGNILAQLQSATASLSDEAKEQMAERFKAEDDAGAIEVAIRELLPQFLGAYDEKRVKPTLDAHAVAQREQRLVSNVVEFDRKYPGARTPAINKKMARLYDEVRDKHGVAAADKIPVQHYFIMVTGGLSSGKKKAAKKSGRSKSKKAAKQKRDALRATRTPDRIVKSRKPGGKRKKKDEVGETFASISANNRDPFHIP